MAFCDKLVNGFLRQSVKGFLRQIVNGFLRQQNVQGLLRPFVDGFVTDMVYFSRNVHQAFLAFVGLQSERQMADLCGYQRLKD